MRQFSCTWCRHKRGDGGSQFWEGHWRLISRCSPLCVPVLCWKAQAHSEPCCTKSLQAIAKCKPEASWLERHYSRIDFGSTSYISSEQSSKPSFKGKPAQTSGSRHEAGVVQQWTLLWSWGWAVPGGLRHHRHVPQLWASTSISSEIHIGNTMLHPRV